MARCCPRPGPPSANPLATTATESTSPSPFLPTFTVGDVLSTKFFYESWVLCLRFRYESIITFSQHKRLSTRQLSDLHFLSRVMLCDGNFIHIRFSPKYLYQFPSSSDLFTMWGGRKRHPQCQYDPLLLLKMSCHMYEIYWGNPNPATSEIELYAGTKVALGRPSEDGYQEAG